VSEASVSGRLGGAGRSLTVLAGLLVVALALGAMLWPGSDSQPGRAMVLVYDSSGDTARTGLVYEPLLAYLTETAGTPLDLAVVATRSAFDDQVAAGADFILCPEGLGLGLDSRTFIPLVVGRRSAPRNLRPRGVLVYRKSAGLLATPWLDRPAATVFGDSVSLTATGMWRRTGQTATAGPGPGSDCSWGPDPYDHAPVLHAARLGAFDYALVRQWDADRFFAGGLLSAEEWDVEIMTVPVPDIAFFAARSVAAQTRLALGDGLSNLGRGSGETTPAAGALRQAVAGLNLAGFNLLVEPDFELVRRNFAGDWPTDTD
jgi:hypothetical protein